MNLEFSFSDAIASYETEQAMSSDQWNDIWGADTQSGRRFEYSDADDSLEWGALDDDDLFALAGLTKDEDDDLEHDDDTVGVTATR